MASGLIDSMPTGFQSTRPCGARRADQAPPRSISVLFQSTRPCGARRRGRDTIRMCSTVSIHAPVRGATGYYVDSEEGMSKFQSTRPCGARPICVYPQWRVSGVSIHAPVRGATICVYPQWRVSGVSIHAPVRGATNVGLLSNFTHVFQSTRPCGARRGKSMLILIMWRCFNPRARAGRDHG